MTDRLALAIEFFTALGLPQDEACDEASRILDRLRARLERYERMKATGDLYYTMSREQLAALLGVSHQTVRNYHERISSNFPRTNLTPAE